MPRILPAFRAAVVVVPVVLSTLTFVSAVPAVAQIGSLWDNDGIGLLIALGDLSPAAGLEALVRADNGTVGIVLLERGPSITALPPPFDDSAVTTYHLRDVDADGLAELLACTVRPDYTSVVGLLEVGIRGDVQRVWPDVELGLGAYDFAGEARLAPGEPHALLFAEQTLKIVAPDQGTIIYDSATDPAIGAMVLRSLLIDDFNGDGNQELLCEFELTWTHQVTSHLIGSTAVSAAPGFGSSFGLTMGKGTPNPAAGATRIAYELPEAGAVSLRIYDAAGRLVRTLENGHRARGAHQAFWDGRDADGRQVASGVYFYELRAGAERMTRKILQVR